MNPKARENYFYQQPGENRNVEKVIYQSVPPSSSAGWDQQGLFASLGHERHKVGSPERNAEQEYLLQGMVKGAMYEAAEIANRSGVGISVRPTGVVAHMGIESGDPTKAQEFKNKTSKELDVFLCDELDLKDVGAVVHYNPRVGWKSSTAATVVTPPAKEVTAPEWEQKKQHILQTRIPALSPNKSRFKSWPVGTGSPIALTPDGEKALRGLFADRAKEYAEEDYDYRFGHYAPYTTLVGPFIRLKLRPEANMVGDHDLFGFTLRSYGLLYSDQTLRTIQIELQKANTFQAQHGGIWNWKPKEAFHKGIKAKIMGAHSPNDGDPLLYIQPGFKVHAVFYIPGREVLHSVWDYPQATKWLTSTHSGRELLKKQDETLGAVARMFGGE
jgi:hypothetical protein